MNQSLIKIIFSGIFYYTNLFLGKKVHQTSKQSNQLITNKISRNLTGLIHALVTLCLSGYYQLIPNKEVYFLMTTISSGYFIFDLWFIYKYDPKTFRNILFIYHHLISLFILKKGPELLMHKILFWAEISNVPIYIVYHYLKTDPKGRNLIIWKQIQKYVYLIARVPILGYYIYQIYFLLDNKYPFYMSFPVYILGVFWCISLFSSK